MSDSIEWELQVEHSPHVERAMSRYKEFQQDVLDGILKQLPMTPENMTTIQCELENQTDRFRRQVLIWMANDMPSLKIIRKNK